MPGAKKIEIFARNHNLRPGWLSIGNQYVLPFPSYFPFLFPFPLLPSLPFPFYLPLSPSSFSLLPSPFPFNLPPFSLSPPFLLPLSPAHLAKEAPRPPKKKKRLGECYNWNHDAITCDGCKNLIETGNARYKGRFSANLDLCKSCISTSDKPIDHFFLLHNFSDEMVFHEFFECMYSHSYILLYPFLLYPPSSLPLPLISPTSSLPLISLPSISSPSSSYIPSFYIPFLTPLISPFLLYPPSSLLYPPTSSSSLLFLLYPFLFPFLQWNMK